MNVHRKVLTPALVAASLAVMLGASRAEAGLSYSCSGPPDLTNIPEQYHEQVQTSYAEFVAENCESDPNSVPEPGTLAGLLALGSAFGLKVLLDRRRR